MKAEAPVHTAAHIPPVNVSTPPPPHADGSAPDESPAQHAGPPDTGGTPVASDAGANGAINARAITTTNVLARIRSTSFTTAIYALYAAQVKAVSSIRAPAPPVFPTSLVFRVGPNLFTEIEVGGDNPASALEPVTPRGDLIWYGAARTDKKDPPEAGNMRRGNWAVDKLPQGFTPTRLRWPRSTLLVRISSRYLDVPLAGRFMVVFS